MRSLQKISCFFSCFLLALLSGDAQQLPGYASRINTVYNNIYRHFYDSSKQVFLEKTVLKKDDRPYAYLWPLCALVQAANEMEASHPGQEYMLPVIKVIDKYYSKRPPHPGYDSYPVANGGGDRFYDDNQWIGIAYMDAYNRTKKEKYLSLSKEIYAFMLTGYDTTAGGGLYWKEFDESTKNTCSNGPGIILALQLYKATRQQEYLDTALMLYQWTNKNLLSEGGLYYDAIHLPDGKIDSRIFTYNTGTMLQSNVLFYQITGHRQYLLDARELASKSLVHFYKDGLFPQNYWFNAVLLRGYQALAEVDEEKKYLAAFKIYADKVWQTETGIHQLIGSRDIKTLIDQSGYLEIICRLADHYQQ